MERESCFFLLARNVRRKISSQCEVKLYLSKINAVMKNMCVEIICITWSQQSLKEIGQFLSVFVSFCNNGHFLHLKSPCRGRARGWVATRRVEILTEGLCTEK